MMSLAGDDRAERHAAGDALGQADDVRLDAPVLDGEHLAGAAHAGLHFVGDQQDAVLVAQLAQLAMELRRRHEVAAFALDRLDEDRRHFVRRDRAVEEVFELVAAISSNCSASRGSRSDNRRG